MVRNNTMTMSITRSPSKFAQASFYYGAASSYTVECLVLAVGMAKKTTRRPNKLAPTFVLRVTSYYPAVPLPAFSVQTRISFLSTSTTTFCFIVVGMVQSLPPPTQPTLQYTQPGGPPPDASYLNAAMPAPPVEELPAPAPVQAQENPSNGAAAAAASKKPPTPQLICFE